MLQSSRTNSQKWITPDTIEGLRGKWFTGQSQNSPGFEITPEAEYWGQWKAGKRHGLGMWRTVGGTQFAGEWVADTTAFGVLEDPKQDVRHQGEFGVGQALKWLTYLREGLEDDNQLSSQVVPIFGLTQHLEHSLGVPGNITKTVKHPSGSLMQGKSKSPAVLISKQTTGTCRLDTPQMLEGFGESILSFSDDKVSVVTGVFKQGKLHGLGVWEHDDSEYTGEWIHGQPDGFGVESCVSQFYSHRGYYRDGLKQGAGQFRGLGRFGYKGEFSKGELHGNGQLEDTEESWVFVGQFQNNKFQGIGQFETQQYFHIGYWSGGRKEGVGFERIGRDNSQVESYFGSFKDGKRHGVGRILPSKSYAGTVGFFQNGKLENELKKSDPGYKDVSKTNLETHMEHCKQAIETIKQTLEDQTSEISKKEEQIKLSLKKHKEAFNTKNSQAVSKVQEYAKKAEDLRIEILKQFETSKDKMIKGLVPLTEEDIEVRTRELKNSSKPKRTHKQEDFDLGTYLDSGAVDDGAHRPTAKDGSPSSIEEGEDETPTKPEYPFESEPVMKPTSETVKLSESSAPDVVSKKIKPTRDTKNDATNKETKIVEAQPTDAVKRPEVLPKDHEQLIAKHEQEKAALKQELEMLKAQLARDAENPPQKHRLSIQLPPESAKASDDYDEESNVQSQELKDEITPSKSKKSATQSFLPKPRSRFGSQIAPPELKSPQVQDKDSSEDNSKSLTPEQVDTPTTLAAPPKPASPAAEEQRTTIINTKTSIPEEKEEPEKKCLDPLGHSKDSSTSEAAQIDAESVHPAPTDAQADPTVQKTVVSPESPMPIVTEVDQTQVKDVDAVRGPTDLGKSLTVSHPNKEDPISIITDDSGRTEEISVPIKPPSEIVGPVSESPQTEQGKIGSDGELQPIEAKKRTPDNVSVKEESVVVAEYEDPLKTDAKGPSEPVIQQRDTAVEMTEVIPAEINTVQKDPTCPPAEAKLVEETPAALDAPSHTLNLQPVENDEVSITDTPLTIEEQGCFDPPPIPHEVEPTMAPTQQESPPPQAETTEKVKQLEDKLKEMEAKEQEWMQLKQLMTQGISAMVQKEETLRQEISQRDAAFKSKQGLVTAQLEAQLKESCPKIPVSYSRLESKPECLVSEEKKNRLLIGGAGVQSLKLADASCKRESGTAVVIDYFQGLIQVKEIFLLEDGRVAVISLLPRSLKIFSSDGKILKSYSEDVTQNRKSKREDGDYPYIRWGNTNERLIWHSVRTGLSVIDCKSYEEAIFDKIFVLPVKNRSLKPSIVLCSIDGSNIFALVFDGTLPVLINYCLPGVKEYLAISPKIALEISTWSCGVRSLEQNFVLIGGLFGDAGVIICLKISNLTTVQCVLKPTPSSSGAKGGSAKQSSGCISEIVRLEGADLYLAASLNDVYCVKFSSGELRTFFTIPTPGDAEIQRIAMVSTGLYLMRPNQECIEFAALGRQIDEELFMRSKHTEESKYRSIMDMQQLKEQASADNQLDRDEQMTKITCFPAEDRLSVEPRTTSLKARSMSPSLMGSPADSPDGSLSNVPDSNLLSFLAKLVEQPKDSKTITPSYSGTFYDVAREDLPAVFSDTDLHFVSAVPRTRITSAGEENKTVAVAGSSGNIDIFEQSSNGLVRIKSINTGSAHSLQTSQSQYLVMQELRTNNLVVVNTADYTHKTLTGASPDTNSVLSTRFEVRNREHRGVILWKNGDDSVALVGLDNPDTPLQVVSPFWNSEGFPIQKMELITLLLKQKPEKILGLALFDKSHYVLRSHDLNKGKTKTLLLHQTLSEIVSKLATKPQSDMETIGMGTGLNEVISIDNSNGTNKFFVALTTDEAHSHRKTIVCEIKITNEGLVPVMATVVTVKQLQSPRRFVSVTVPTHPVEYVLLFGDSTIAVLSAEDKSFAIVHLISNLASIGWLDCCILNSSMYCVSDKSKYILDISKTNKGGTEGQDSDEMTSPNKDAAVLQEKTKFSKYTVERVRVDRPLSQYFHMVVDWKSGSIVLAGQGAMRLQDALSVTPKTGATVNSSFAALRYSEHSGSLIGLEAGTFDLVELNLLTFAELRRLKGVQGHRLEHENRRDIRHSADKYYMPWFKGNGDLTIVSLIDFSYQDRPGFFMPDDSDEVVIPQLCLTSSDGVKVIGVAVRPEKGTQIFIIQESRSEVAIKLGSLPGLISGGFILAAELLEDQNVLLVGGSDTTEFENGTSKAILTALTFDKKLSYITDLKIDERDNRFVSKIRRIPETNRFFAATIDMIYVYEFKNRKFYKLSVIENASKSVVGITDMVYHKNTLYAFTAGDTEISRIEFASY